MNRFLVEKRMDEYFINMVEILCSRMGFLVEIKITVFSITLTNIFINVARR